MRPCVEEKVIERKMAMVGTHLSGITRFLSPISGESTSAKRQTYASNGQMEMEKKWRENEEMKKERKWR